MGEQKKPTLAEFIVMRKRQDCPVCQLPVEVRGQLAEARGKKIRIAEQVAWLSVIGHDIKEQQLTQHNSARHEQ